ncbi:DUF4386 domain-containing protein [Nocardioides panacis]|uniref:DUF4386 domain-containing protein n=1 Tax=Nocardioides panacis TaxID=2849501 RepID=A0A975SXK4_9ACTN|nr:DUF4386 domain-containing protein [Nocardioides panacis]QWZ07290.1 DUF4386 domain-containing protein [Nocardioides panacis]
MTTTVRATRTPPAERASMDPARRSAFFGGLFYLITFASSIPAVFLLRPVIDDPHYIIGSGADTQVVWGTLLDLVNALTAVGSAVALYPVMKRQSQSMALGFVSTRMFEAAVVAIGVVSLLTVVSLRQPGATGAEAHTLEITGQALVASYNWVFLVGPNLMPALNGLLLGTLMYKSGLVPKVIPAMGLVGGPPAARRHGRLDARPHPSRLRLVDRGRADRRLGVLARRVPDLQGLQAGADHRRHGAVVITARPREHLAGVVRAEVA